MSLLWFDSFDHFTTAQLDEKGYASDNFSPSISTNNGRRDTNSLYFTGSNNYNINIPVSSGTDTLIVGFAFKPTVWSSTNQTSIPCLRSDSDKELTLRLNYASHKLELMRGEYGETLLATGTTALILNAWHYIELKAFIDNSSGFAIVRLNGNVEINFSGDTQTTSNSLTKVFFQENYSTSFHIDDLYICDASGSKNNDFLGDVRVDTLFPNSAGNYTQWTPSTGANYQCVDEAIPNDDTDYVYTTVSGNRDSYTIDSLVTISGEVFGINIHNWAKKADAGFKSLRNFLRTGGTDYDFSVKNLSDSYLYFSERAVENNPITASGWTISEINSLEVGIKSE